MAKELDFFTYNERDYFNINSTGVSQSDVLKWLRSNNTISLINIFERENNPNFEIKKIKSIKPATLSFKMIKAICKEDIISFFSIPGRRGGTYLAKELFLDFCIFHKPEIRYKFISNFTSNADINRVVSSLTL